MQHLPHPGDLCSTYRIPVSNIRSHAESFRDGYASNHGDPDHWFKRFGRTMDAFRADVAKELAGGSETVGKVQRRYGFSDETMAYLQAYRYADALLKKLSEQ